MEDLWRLSATDVAAAIKFKKVSARQVAEAALARLDAVNPALNAVVDHRPEDVLAQAAEVDAAIARNEALGPLAGVPVTVKVNIDQAGYANTNGLNLQRDNIARENSPVIDNLRKSGAVILGRTNCPGFFLSLVHHQSRSWRHQEPARSLDHAGRVVRRRRVRGRGRHRSYRAWHRHRGARSAFRPMPAAFTDCGRPPAGSRRATHR